MVSFAQEGKAPVSYGFNLKKFGGDEDIVVQAPAPPPQIKSFVPLASSRSQVPHASRNAGLGKSLGGQLTRSAFGGAAYSMLDPGERARQLRHEHSPNTLRQRKVKRLTAEVQADVADGTTRPWITAPLTDNEPQGMFRELLLSDQGWASEQQSREDLRVICDHRWTFRGAMELAERSRSLCFFVRCLLDLQRNVQLEDEGDALDPKLVKACALFVTGQCNMGHAADMYQLLTHFISNAVIFDEWDRYLKGAFESERAKEESFLIPYLEQVWGRFCRLIDVLEEIFLVLNSRFVWLHRLPRVGDLVREHMKRRCFSGDSVNRNDLISSEKCSNETVKAIKRAFGFNT